MLKDIVTSEVRIKIIHEFFKDVNKPLHIRELARRVDTEINAVRRELLRFHKAGLLKKEARMNRVYYQIKKDYSIYPEIFSIVAKEIGLGSIIIKNLTELGKVKFALLSRAFVEGRISTTDQVDLLIVGAVDIKFLQEIIKNYEAHIEREINYTVLGEEEFFFVKTRKDPIINGAITQSRVILVGDENKYCSYI